MQRIISKVLEYESEKNRKTLSEKDSPVQIKINEITKERGF